MTAAVTPATETALQANTLEGFLERVAPVLRRHPELAERTSRHLSEDLGQLLTKSLRESNLQAAQTSQSIEPTEHPTEQAEHNYEAAIAEMNAFLRKGGKVREGAPSQDDNWDAYQRLVRNADLVARNKGKYLLFVDGYVRAVTDTRSAIGRLYLATEGEVFMVGLPDPDGPRTDVRA